MTIYSYYIIKYFSSILFVKRLTLCILSLSYLAGLILGFMLCDLIPSVQDIEYGNHSVINQLSTMKPLERFLFIAENNVLVGCKCFLGGLFTLGIFPIINNLYSAFVFGIVLKKGAEILPIEKILSTTLPHSFEIIGIIGMGYAGTILGISFLCKRYYLSFIKIALLSIVSLLFILISAGVENYISIC